MVSKPQYCYAVSLYICAKLHDLTYPHLDLFLEQCQKADRELRQADKGETSFFTGVLVDFADFEIEILKAAQASVTFVPEPNGDQVLNAFALYSRFACAQGFAEDSVAYHLGLYLLFISVIDIKLVTENTYVELACASLYLSMRMVHHQTEWPSYLRDLTQLDVADFYTICRPIAQIFICLFNQE